jgi:hypothetical protein
LAIVAIHRCKNASREWVNINFYWFRMPLHVDAGVGIDLSIVSVEACL